jgi:type I restriction enzyme S subunit
LKVNGGDVFLMFTGSEVGFTTIEKAGKHICEGEVIAIPWGGTPNVKYWKGKFVTADNRIATSNNTDLLSNKFLYYWMSSSINVLKMFYRGASIKHPSMDDVLNMTITLPNNREQRKISEFLSNIDLLITNSQKKYNKLQNIKKALLEKMFPKNGENVPEIRFKGFTDTWEQQRLIELGESFEYGLNASAKEFDGKNKYLRITDIDESSRQFLEKELTSPETNLDLADNFKLEYGDILFARTGASVGKSYIYQKKDGNVYYAGYLIRVRVKQTYYPEFVFYNTLTENYKKYIYITSQRSGQPGVNAKEYANYTLKVPGINEQKKIGDFFLKLDNTIRLHKEKHERLLNIKKALLQKMFV